MSRRAVRRGRSAGIAVVALALRLVFPTADPPWETTVGIVWHDEGAWVHNARNKALFGDVGDRTRGTRCTSRRCSPALEYAVVRDVRRRRLAGAAGVGADRVRVGAAARARRPPPRRPRRRRSSPAALARDQLRLRDVEPRGADGSVDGRLHRRLLVLLRAGAEAARLGRCSPAAFALLAFFTKAAAVFFVAALGLEAVVAIVMARTPAAQTAATAGRR